MKNILIYLKLLSRKFDSGNILYMSFYDYLALSRDYVVLSYQKPSYCHIDKLLYDKYGKEKLWLYMNNGYIEKFVWDEVWGRYVQ